MKRETLLKTAIGAAFIIFIFYFGAQPARAQNVQPFVDCVELDNSSGKYIAYFGYINYGATTVFVPLNTAGNNLTPVRNPPGQPENFLPGINHRVFSVKVDFGTSETWRLTTYSTTVSPQTAATCDGEGTNARLMTYQGKLSDGNAAANGVYDLQFQLFNAATDGTARTTKITVEDVPVANGIFTVQLNLGANSVVNAGNISQSLNPSILTGENGFFEIGVRPGTSIDNFTTLTPRQPLTAVPMAMRANTANNAIRAAFAGYADYGSNNFQVVGDASIKINPFSLAGGNFTVERTLTVNGTINGTVTNATNATNADKLGGVDASQYVKTNSAGDLVVGCRSGFTAVAGGRLCVSAMQPANTFYNAAQVCTNMGARIGNSSDVALSFTLSGFNYFETSNPVNSNNPKGWLADIIGDDVRATWNVNSPNPNFDGTPLNVFNGGANGNPPTLLFRCVY